MPPWAIAHGAPTGSIQPPAAVPPSGDWNKLVTPSSADQEAPNSAPRHAVGLPGHEGLAMQSPASSSHAAVLA
jgi:hypothetical protein